MNLNNLSKADIDIITQIPSEHRNKLLKVALTIINPSRQDYFKTIEKLSNDFNLKHEDIYKILGTYIALIRQFTELNDKEFNNKLLEIGFSDDFVDNLPLVSNRKEIVEAFAQCRRMEYGKLVSLKWRIDISLSNSSLVKKVPHSVILSLVLKDGRKITISVDIKTFHKLRFNIALVLKELTAIKANSSIITSN